MGGWDRWRAGSTLLLTLATVALVLTLASSALAKTFTVNRTDDPNPPGGCSANCSLRAAVFAADDHSGADTIRFAKSLPPEIEVTQGNLPIRRELEIDGPGSKKLAVSASQQSRVFHVLSGRVTIRGITIRDGRERATANGPRCPGNSSSSFTYALGGGILQDAGRLSLDHVRVSNNSVRDPGSQGVTGGGGIAMIGGRLSIAHSELAENASSGAVNSTGGGVFSCGGTVTIKKTDIHDSAVTSDAVGFGGGIFTQSLDQDRLALTMKQSTVSHNNVSASAVASGGGISVVLGPAKIDASTISDNDATATRGGLAARGAGLYVQDARASVTNTTIANNVGTGPDVLGGGVLVFGTGDMLDLRSSTLVGNSADGTDSARGGNLASLSSATLRNTIVAKGEATTGSNCDGPVKSSSHDLEDKNTCGFDGEGDLVNKNPKIGSLAENGGPTRTIALRRGSPAIDHASKKTSPNRDQRGFLRGDEPDIGAYEFGAKP
jgi:hypothetical protein